MDKKLKLKEIVVVAMLSAIIGVVFTFLDGIYKPLEAIAGPVGGDIIGGLYFISALLSVYIVRKPGSALMGSLFTGLINLLMGSPYGIHIIVASTLQGIGVEAVLATKKYENYSFIYMSLSAILATLLVTTRDYFIFGLDLYAGLLPVMIIIRVLSAVVFGAGFTIVLGKGLNSTGVFSGFNINKKK
jgi:energy-coupling factor transport system substrate-specific component